MLAKLPDSGLDVLAVSPLVPLLFLAAHELIFSGLDGLDDPLKFIPEREITQLKKRISEAIIAIRDKI